MIMATSDATISMRVPSEVKERLEKAALRTHRSRSYITIAALKKYLPEIEQEELQSVPKSKLEIALSFKGAGQRAGSNPKTVEEIDASVREFRGDE